MDPGLSQLLHESEQLVQRDHEGFPTLQRDLRQLQDLSSKLGRAGERGEQAQQSIQASRLLAQQGLDGTRLQRNLDQLELGAVYEDSQPGAQWGSIDQYLRHLQTCNMYAALQDADQVSDAYFVDTVRQRYEKQLQEPRPHMLSSFLLGQAAATSTGQAAASTSASGQGMGQNGAPPMISNQEAVLGQVVKDMGRKSAAGEQFDVIAAYYNAAYSTDKDGVPNGFSRCWGVLRCMSQELAASGAGAASSSSASSNSSTSMQRALLKGACKYLEESFQSHMTAQIDKQRPEAMLGAKSSWTNLSRVQAYLRLRFRDVGVPLDLHAKVGLAAGQGLPIDTSWLQIYYCLRAGYADTAEQIAGTVRMGFMQRDSQPFSIYLKKWIQGGGIIRDQSTMVISQHVAALLRDDSLSKAHKLDLQYQGAVCCLLCGNSRLTDALLRSVSSLSQTIEDFMWLKLQCCRAHSEPAQASQSYYDGGAGVGSGAGVGGSAGSGGVRAYSIQELQEELQVWQPSHYTKNGKEPEQYVAVLLMSLQFQQAVVYLRAEQQAAGSNKLAYHAVHFGLAVQQMGVLECVPASTPQSNSVGWGGMVECIEEYAYQVVGYDPELGLALTMASSKLAVGPLVQERARLLRSLMLLSHPPTRLLGGSPCQPGAPGSILALYVSDRKEREAILTQVGDLLRTSGNVELGVEVFQAAGSPRSALTLCNQLMAQAIQQDYYQRTNSTPQLQGTKEQAKAAATSIKTTATALYAPEVEEYDILGSIHQAVVLANSSRYTEAELCLDKLSFLPKSIFDIDKATQQVGHLHHTLQMLLKIVVPVAARVAYELGRNHLQALATYSSKLNSQLGRETQLEVARLAGQVSF